MLYEAASLAMRYWFVVVIVIVFFGAVVISVKEYRQKHFVLGVAQNSIGYLSILSGPDDVLGENLQLMQENTIGRSRRVDIVLADRSVNKAHSQVYLDEYGDVCINRLGDGEVTINGESLEDNALIFTDDIVCFGNVVTQVHIKEDDGDDT
ncbi:MAG: FHA domain-containing protein [Clostridia bacterium]|jgi:hypothetical protein|nr:FHA domain-containing protein [Clostridia bacterium]MBT7122478.1 FHA domain-containing protein [Clostridia bacterium]